MYLPFFKGICENPVVVTMMAVVMRTAKVNLTISSCSSVRGGWKGIVKL